MSVVWDRVEALTFDCYGTLVDWETGILEAVGVLVGAATIPDRDRILELFGRLESKAEAGPFRSYRSVLEEVARGFGQALDVPVDEGGAARFAASVGRWPPFDDTVDALERLGTRFRLAVVSNVDDDLFAETSRHLGVSFDDVVTAQQVRSYKPEPGHFVEVIRRLGVPRDRMVHVAQSLYHDIGPARAMGIATIWIDRRGGRGGGATPPAQAVPDLRMPDLASLASAAGV